MVISDYRGVTDEVADAAHLENVLERRYEGSVNEFWLYDPGEGYPLLGIVVKGSLASLDYFPREGHPGFRSLGNVVGLERGGVTTFLIGGGKESLDLLNETVVPFSAAVAAAKDFLASRELPKCIQWCEL